MSMYFHTCEIKNNTWGNVDKWIELTLCWFKLNNYGCNINYINKVLILNMI